MMKSELPTNPTVIPVGKSKLTAMLPPKSERALFLGQTGSGKTTLARQMLSKRKYVVIYDGKGMIRWRGYRRVESLKALMKLNPKENPKVVYQPPISEMNIENIELFFKWVYERRFCTVYIDEVYSITQFNIIPDWYKACITRGRERGVEVWNSVQRPVFVPLNVISETENIYVFRLMLEEDCKRVRQITGLPTENIRALEKHLFYYCRIGEHPEGQYKLNLK